MKTAEVRHLGHVIKGGDLYIAGQDWNFAWMPEEIEQVKKLWCEGWHIADISRIAHRPDHEIVILIMSLAEEGRTGEREGGIFGTNGT